MDITRLVAGPAGFADIGLTPQALFDTEIAARMLGLHRFGLAAVTEHYLGVTLAKEHSAADWSYRPLPRDWRNYAALDVELLIELRRKMQRELKSQGKDGWADEEFRYALQTGMGPRREHPVPWLRISHINTVSQDHQASPWPRRCGRSETSSPAPMTSRPDCCSPTIR